MTNAGPPPDKTPVIYKKDSFRKKSKDSKYKQNCQGKIESNCKNKHWSRSEQYRAQTSGDSKFNRSKKSEESKPFRTKTRFEVLRCLPQDERFHERRPLRYDRDRHKERGNSEGANHIMGKNNVVDTGPFAASDACGKHGVKRRQRGGLHFRVKSNTTNQAHVHQTHDFDTNTGTKVSHSRPNARQNASEGRRHDPDAPSMSNYKGPNPVPFAEDDTTNGNRHVSSVQNSIKGWRSGRDAAPGRHNTATRSHYNRLGATYQGNAISTLPPGHVHGNRGDLYQQNIPIPYNLGPCPALQYGDDRANFPIPQDASWPRLQLPQLKAWGDPPSNDPSGGEYAHNRGGTTYGAAQAIEHTSPIFWPQRDNCNGAGYPEGNANFVGSNTRSRDSPNHTGITSPYIGKPQDGERMACVYEKGLNDAAWSPKRVWSRIHRKTERPTQEMMQTLPIHARRVKPLRLHRIRDLMLPHVRTRFDQIWGKITNPTGLLPQLKPSPVTTKDLTHSDIKSLMQADIIERVEHTFSNPTRAWVIPFTNLESRNGQFRRRFITWTKQHNEAIATTYKAEMPLEQPVKYVSQVREECAVQRDLSSAFFQLELPAPSRPFYRFIHAGATYQMTRMPMGHSMAPEVMQIITSVIAGHTSYTTHSILEDASHLDVYVDGFRLCGKRDVCRDYAGWVFDRALFSGVTLKDYSFDPEVEYDWLGVRYHHESQCYRMNESFIEKIPGTLPLEAPYYFYETLCARLVYASGILQIPLPRYYWIIKYVRRQVSKLNKGMISDTTLLQPPPGTMNQLHDWAQEVKRNTWQTYVGYSSQAATLYTDASLDGWGAVLFLPGGTVYGTGAPWIHKTEINEGEALAVENALLSFQPHWKTITTINLYVDNTSVEYALRKRWADSESIARVLVRLCDYMSNHNLKVIPRYVSTKQNYADPWSRNRYLTWRQDGMELANGAGADGPFVSQ